MRPTSYADTADGRIAQEWQQYHDYYTPERLQQTVFFYHQPRHEARFFDTLKVKYRMQPGQRMLDVGCGTGFYAQLWHERGLQITGVDLSDRAIAHCQQRLPHVGEWICGDAFSLPYRETFDYAWLYGFTFFNAFTHPKDATSYAEKLMHYLKPGGRLFFIWHSDLTGVRLPVERFSLMNYTVPQLLEMFSGYKAEGFLMDSPAHACVLGRLAFHRYVSRLSAARVMLQASSWKRARLVVVVTR